jgi:hypothetical protein
MIVVLFLNENKSVSVGFFLPFYHTKAIFLTNFYYIKNTKLYFLKIDQT